MLYAIDIETYPNLDLIKKLPKVKADSRLKDPEKIKIDIEKKENDQISKMALNPLWGKIACIGVYNNEYQFCRASDDEKELLESFYIWLKSNETKEGKRFVTYNGKSFDLPFLFKRMAVLGICSLEELSRWNNRYNNHYQIDLMLEWCDFGKFEKLDTLANVLLDENKIDFDITSIKDLIKSEDGKKEIEKYCLKDCEITYRLAKLLGY